ncbi:hypothetical protein HY213_02145 [Candidatus Peregrinibacteria bacterium]|nr:hypothetical protein [Candidatus Peregrinibacteria bacterium]
MIAARIGIPRSGQGARSGFHFPKARADGGILEGECGDPRLAGFRFILRLHHFVTDNPLPAQNMRKHNDKCALVGPQENDLLHVHTAQRRGALSHIDKRVTIRNRT